jgi:hypothetical protein
MTGGMRRMHVAADGRFGPVERVVRESPDGSHRRLVL